MPAISDSLFVLIIRKIEAIWSKIPADLLSIADYSHLTAMLAPRPALLIYNEHDDCCFSSLAHVFPSNRVDPFYQLLIKRMNSVLGTWYWHP